MGCGSSKGDPAKNTQPEEKKGDADVKNTEQKKGVNPMEALAMAQAKKRKNENESINPFLPPFDVKNDIATLETAIMNDSHKDMIDLLCGRTRDQRLKIVKEFSEEKKLNAIGSIEAKTGGKFKEVLVAMLQTETEFDVFQLHRAIHGAGTTESVIIEVLATRSNREIKAITDMYEQKHGKSLSKAIESETMGDFENLLAALCEGNRDEGSVDNAVVKQDSDALYRAGEGRTGTNDSKFVQIFSKRSPEHLQALAKEYETQSTKTLAQAIEDEVSGHFKDALLALLDPVKYTTNLLFDAMHGAGTNDEALIRLLTRLDDDTPRFCAVIDCWANSRELHDHWKTPLTSGSEKWTTLVGAVDSEVSGDYGKVLRRLICQSRTEWRAVLLHEAMDGLGTDEDAVSRVLTTFSSEEEKKETQRAYATMFRQELPAILGSELSGNHAALMKALGVDRVTFDADNLAKAMIGAGTTESVLLEILTTRSDEHMKKVKEAYATTYGKPLEEAIKDESRGECEKVLVALLDGGRSKKKDIELDDAKRIAKTIYEKGEGQWGTDDDAFIRIFTTHSPEEFLKIDQAYTAEYGRTLEDAIKKETSGDYEQALIACLNPHKFVARRFHHAVAGIGTDDAELIRLVAHRPKDELKAIGEVYEQLYDKNLLEAIRSDTSGGYRATLEACFH